jgi:hypothetical protein
LIDSLSISGQVLQYSFRKFDTRQRLSLPTIFPATVQAFGVNDEKVLPEDALAKALGDFLFP